jgi:hypothetical protein
MEQSMKANRRFFLRTSALAAAPLVPLSLGWSGEAQPKAAITSPHRDFVHPGVLHTRNEIDFILDQITAGAEPWASAWEALREHETAQLGYQPKSRAHVERGVRNNPNIGGNDFLRDGSAAYAHALVWNLSDERSHAEKAIEILDAWASTLETVTNHDARLLVGMGGINFANAAELVRHSFDAWSSTKQGRLDKMFREVLYPVIADFYPSANGNWDASMLQTMLALAVYLDDRTMFDRATAYFLEGAGNGAIGRYFNAFGECQESGRDQGHTQMGLGYLGCAAEIAWKQGVDLYGALDNRLALGYEYTARYNLGHDVPYEPYLSFEGRYHYETISEDGRGRFSNIYERAYHHYHDRKGLEMPHTKQALECTRPENWDITYVSWNTLMCNTLPTHLK